MLSKKSTMIIAAIILVLIVISGVYVGVYIPQTQIQSRANTWKSTLIIGTSVGRYENPDPIIGYGSIKMYQNTGRLLAIDNKLATASALHPVMAESWSLQHKLDGTPFVQFKIKQGLKFNDGTEVNATAIKTSLERMLKLDPRYTWTRAAFSFRTLEAPDTYTLNAVMDSNFGYVGTLFVLAYYYGSIESPTGRDRYGNGSKILGFAPYNTVDFTVNERAVLQKYDGYIWADQYPWKTLIWQNFPEPSSLRLALEKGDIDIASYGLSKFDLQSLQSNPSIQVGWQEGHVRTLVMSYNYPPLNNPLVRQAIAEVIDQDAIVKGSEPMCTPLYSLPQTRMGYSDDQAWTSRYGKHDVTKAKALMAQAGYPNGFKTELWVQDQYQDMQAETNMATVIKEQLAKIRIDVDVKSAVYSIYTQKRNSGNLPLALAGWWEDYPDVDSYISYLFDQGQVWAKVTNMSGNPHYAQILSLVKQGRTIYDPAKETPVNPDRKKIYDQIHELNAQDAIYVPLYTEKRGEAWKTWVKGYVQPWTYQLFSGIAPYKWDYQIYKEPPPGMFATGQGMFTIGDATRSLRLQPHFC